MTVTRTNVDFAKRILADRVGNDYVYGGNWNPNDINVGTDCSGLVIDVCDAVRNGPGMAWSRHGMSTESWRPIEVGQTGTIFNTVCVASPNDFPPDAVVKIALHHGPGGGANSHMWCEVDGVRGESNGDDGCVTGGQARSVYDTSYANDWHYLPGPIDGAGTSPPPQSGPLWGVDISNHQGDMDIAQVKREGFDFLFAKVSEGDNYADPYWPRNRDLARQNGLILAGYHYVRTGNPDAQAELFARQLGDPTIPAMLDFEDGSGDIDQFWAVIRAFAARGVQVRLSYIPDWYWERIGSPDLSGVPGLIASEYVTGAGYASALYPGDGWKGWNPYGGRTPDILQFTSSANVAGLSVDAMAFKGSRDDLARLLGQPTTGEDELAGANIDGLNRLVDGFLTPQPDLHIYRDSDDPGACLLDRLRGLESQVMELVVETEAERGDPSSLEKVRKVAEGRAPVQLPAWAVDRAESVLAQKQV